MATIGLTGIFAWEVPVKRSPPRAITKIERASARRFEGEKIMKDKLGKLTVREFISAHLRQSGVSIEEVSLKCGWGGPQPLRMILEGVTKLPIPKVPELANALGIDSGDLLGMVMREYMPETWETLMETFQGLSYTPAERMVIERVREFIEDHGGEADVVEARGAVALVVVEP
jgi:hypothetical protein